MPSLAHLNLCTFRRVVLMSGDLLAVKSQIKRGRQGQRCLLHLQYESVRAIETLNNNSKLCLNRQKRTSRSYPQLVKISEVFSEKYEAEVKQEVNNETQGK